jgi:hypothetical protein
MDSSYSDFLATHPPVFADASDPLEVDSSLCIMESTFGLRHCIEYQKTLYAAPQLRGSTGTLWASYIAALPADHHVPWDEFRAPFRAHHLSTGLLHTKLNEFLDLEQGNHSVFYYTSSSTPSPNRGHTTSTWMRSKLTSTVMGLSSTCKSTWVFPPTFPTMN